MKKENTLRELLIGIVFTGAVMQIVSLCVSNNYLYDAIGVWSGIGISCFSAIHMKNSIEVALELGEDGAVKHMRGGYMVRMLVTLLIAGAVIYFDWGNPIALLISIFSLKLAAYLQPCIHKLFQKMQNHSKGGRAA